MATIANWNGHTFEVSPNLVRGFTELSIKGGCETTTKNSSKQKYEERKYGEGMDITLNAHLNALSGVTDVMSEAMAFVQEANEGASDYFYMGTVKLVAAKLLLKGAEITEIETMPGKGDRWISCSVKLTFKQGSKNDSGSGSSGSSGGGSKKKSVRTTGVKATATAAATTETWMDKLVATAKANIAAARQTANAAKEASKATKTNNNSLASLTAGANAVRATTTNKNTAKKTKATTGRSGSAQAARTTQSVR